MIMITIQLDLWLQITMSIVHDYYWLHPMNMSFSNNESARRHLSGLNTLPAMEKKLAIQGIE